MHAYLWNHSQWYWLFQSVFTSALCMSLLVCTHGLNITFAFASVCFYLLIVCPSIFLSKVKKHVVENNRESKEYFHVEVFNRIGHFFQLLVNILLYFLSNGINIRRKFKVSFHNFSIICKVKVS